MWEPADEGQSWWTKIGTQFVQPSTKGVEGAEWENLYCKLAVMNKEVYVRNFSGRSKAKTLLKIRDAKKEVTRIVTDPRRKLSVGRMSTKSRGVYSSRARPLPCQRRLRKVETWEDAESSAGKGAEADFMCVSSCAVSGRLASGGSVQVFLCAEQCLPLGGASRFEVLVCSHLRVFSGFSGSLARSFVVCFQFTF